MPDTMRQYRGLKLRVARGHDRTRGGLSREPRWRRVLVAVAVTITVLAGVPAGAGFLLAEHLLSSIHRIGGIAALTARDQPIIAAGRQHGMTVLLTGSAVPVGGPAGQGRLGSSANPQLRSGLIALVHINVGDKAGAVVSIPSTVVAEVPGHGRMQIYDALKIGGPSLLIRTIEELTGVRIDHYSVLDFAGVGALIDAIGGVQVVVPRAETSFGQHFRAGLNHLSSANVLAYVRKPADSQTGRVLRQQNLIRAICAKMSQIHALGSFGTDYAVAHALADTLSVDSNFSNSQLVSLILSLAHLHGDDGVFVSAPTVNGDPLTGGLSRLYLKQPESRVLWSAIRAGSIASFAKRHPATVTPIAPG
jgi:LCP family protein required for cell wall assembly